MREPVKTHEGVPSACGGVTVDGEGRVLLRKTADHGGMWTFAEAVALNGESPEETALRAVREQCGITAEIAGRLPGPYNNDGRTYIYFLMRPVSIRFSDEVVGTEALRWATREEALDLVNAVSDRSCGERVLKALTAALGGE